MGCSPADRRCPSCRPRPTSPPPSRLLVATMVSQCGAPPTTAPAPLLTFDDSAHRAETLCRLNTLRRHGQFCDVVFEVGRHSVPAHRAVLASTSLYLFELLATETTTPLSYVRLDPLDYDSFEILINYAYTSR